MTALMFERMAHQHFEYARHTAFWRDLFSRLTRKCNELLAFEQICQGLSLKGQYYRGLQVICLDKIIGSEGRYLDFDRAFFPRQDRTKDRWVRIDRTYYEEVSLPPVELVKVGEVYFVRDGNHRISVARAHGQEFIDAYIIELDVSAPPESKRG